jgi:farnesyl-diphosphate farnesyltransferase
MLDRTEAGSDAAKQAYCRSILPHVSRTFALCIPVLDEPLRFQVGVAYLLCRIVDTVEDREDLDPETRHRLFEELARLVREPADAGARRRFQELLPPHPDPHHEDLLRHAGDVLDCFAAFEPGAFRDVRECLDEMITGMSAYPGPGAGAAPVEACQNLDELERYCHVVAGTVGILLSRFFERALGDARWLTPARAEAGRRFGLGLQLTNVIKDHDRDHRRGITYLPRAWFRTLNGRLHLRPEAARRVIGRALEHLDTAEAYILSLPRRRTDMRRFCLYAAHLALATLYLAARPAGERSPAKVSHEDLALILGRVDRHADDDAGLESLYRGYRDAVAAAVGAL